MSTLRSLLNFACYKHERRLKVMGMTGARFRVADLATEEKLEAAMQAITQLEEAIVRLTDEMKGLHHK